MMFDFFVSHSSIDKDAIVDSLVNTLQNMGYSVWYDKNEILAGDNISLAVKKGLKNSYCLILILTNNFFESKWTFFEAGTFDAYKNRIIPLIYDISESQKSSILSMIGNLKYLNMNTITKEETARELLKTLSRIKNENKDLETFENLRSIQKQLASHETVNSEILSIKLKEYLELFDTHKEFLVLAAKQIVKIVIGDLLKHNGHMQNITFDNMSVTNLLKEYNIGSVNFREYIEFVLHQDSEKQTQEYLPILNHALSNILTFYLHTRYPIDFSFSQIEVVLPNDLSYKDFVDMFEIDMKVLREDLVADIDTAYSWYKHNKYTHIGARDVASKKLIGYFSVLPITDETYRKILGGDFQDKDFTIDSIEQYIFSNFYRVYIAAVAIDPEYQNTGAFIKLYNALIDLFLFLAKDREIYISEVLAEASTKQGEKFCKMVGMKKISATTNDTDVYRLVTIPPEFQLRNRKGKELYELCQNKFKEYREYFAREHFENKYD